MLPSISRVVFCLIASTSRPTVAVLSAYLCSIRVGCFSICTLDPCYGSVTRCGVSIWLIKQFNHVWFG
jgi:hypothetical protein